MTYADQSVSRAGEVNGDGIDDLVLGACGVDDGGDSAGEAHVVSGRDLAGGATPFGSIDLSKTDPADDFIGGAPRAGS